MTWKIREWNEKLDKESFGKGREVNLGIDERKWLLKSLSISPGKNRNEKI